MDKNFHQKPLSNLELAEFCNQMALLLRSGISPLEGLMLLAEDAQSEEEKTLLAVMIEELESTGFLYDAISSTNVFPAYLLHMVRLGEETGCLDEIMGSLADHYIREANFASMIRNSLIYPCIMLGMMGLVITILLTKVMPVFQQVFRQLGQELTGFSVSLLKAGEMLSRHSILFVAFTVILLLALIFGRHKLPFMKKIQATISSCRFCGGMSIALKSGITPEESLVLAANLVEDDVYHSKIATCKDLIAEENNLASALYKSGLLSSRYSRTASLAEKTGRLDEALSEIASEYEHDANSKITGMIAILEPTLVIILSIIVGIILFSVMFPLLGILAGL